MRKKKSIRLLLRPLALLVGLLVAPSLLLAQAGRGSEALAPRFYWNKIGLEEGLPALEVQDIQEGPAGYTWLATEGAGLVRFDGYQFASIRNDDYPLVTALHTDTKQRLWLRTDRSLVLFDGHTFQDYPLPPGERLVEWSWQENSAWLLSRSGQLYRWEGDSLRQGGTAPPGTRQIALWQGHLYAAGDSGLYRRKDQDFQRLRAVALREIEGGRHLRGLGPEGFYPQLEVSAQRDTALGITFTGMASSDSATVLWNDAYIRRIANGDSHIWAVPQELEGAALRQAYWSQEGLWVLVTSQGLHLQRSSHDPRWMGPQDVQALTSTNAGWVLGGKEGLYRLQGQRLTALGTGLGLILSLATFQDELFLGTERGLWRERNGNYELLPASREQFIFAMLADSSGLWLGTGTGIWRYEDQNLWHVQSPAIARATVYSLRRDAGGTIWAATHTQGLYRYDGEDWSQVLRWAGLALDSLRFSALEAGDADELWLGTQNDGLYHLRDSLVDHFSFEELGYAEIRALAQTPGDLWLGTNKGLLAGRELLRRRRHPGMGPLPFLGEAIQSQALQGQGDTLYAGLKTGVQRWELPAYRRSTEPPRCYVNEVSLLMDVDEGLGNYARDSVLYSGLQTHTKLPHDRNYLVFKYGARSLARPEELRYRYRLLGQDEQWTRAGTRREAIFTHLSPGSYRFEVQARRPLGEWTGPVAQYTFQVQAAFYTTWWFYSGLAVVVGGLAFLLIRDRIRRSHQRLRMENELLEMERKALRLQMNPHFIFNALDSISSFIFRKEPKQAVRYLNNFAKLMRLTLESSMEHLHPVETEVSILKNYLELEKLRFGDKFDFTIEVDEAIDYNIALPPMLVQPHVENAILHGLKPKSEPGFLHISFRLQGDLLCCSIEDNGVGREKARSLQRKRDHRSRATEINRDRIRLLQNSLSGEVELHIHDLYDSRGQPRGTQVVLQLPAADWDEV